MTLQAKKRFGELLVEEDRIKEQDLERALGEQKKYGQKLGQVLLKMGLLSEEVIAEALGRHLGIPVAKLDECDLSRDLVGLIPKNIARNCNVIPIERHYSWIRVAMTDPLDIAAMDQVAHFLRLEVLPSIATESEINRAFERYYGTGSPIKGEEIPPGTAGTAREPEALRGMQGERAEPPETDRVETIVERVAPLLSLVDEPLLSEEQYQEMAPVAAANPVVCETATIDRLVAALISQALTEEATDIHIESDVSGGYVRMRVDGRLRIMESFRGGGASSTSNLLRTIKAMAGLEETSPGQGDGRFDFSQTVSVRVSTCTTINGERAVLRIVDRELSAVGLDGLGITSDLNERLRKALRQPGGLFLCCGPVGSGKTTTLYGIINHLNGMDKAIVTIEDPIEYPIDHVAQVEAKGFTLLNGARSILRQDPDVYALSELTEREIAILAVQAGLSGVTTISTLCWSDTAGALTRLIEMGVDPSLLASSVVCVIGQRLIRKICEGCKESYTPPPPILDSINVNETAALYRGKGCQACRNTGYRGRTAVFELLFVNDELRKMISARATRRDIEKAAIAAGMKTMREDAIKKALLGITTLEEALNRTRTEAQTA